MLWLKKDEDLLSGIKARFLQRIYKKAVSVLLVTLFRTIILYVFVIVALRIMGKRQIGDMQPGELVITILISELASMPIQDTTQPVINGILAIFTLVVLEIIISFISMKFTPAHRIINGRSAVLIKDGVINQKLMKTMRVTVTDLMEVLRGQDVFDISEVAYAILETNGQLSILLKSACQPVTREEAGIKTDGEQIKVLVVNDGVIIEEGLRLAEINRSDVEKEIKKQGLRLGQVFLMTADTKGGFYTVKKDESI